MSFRVVVNNTSLDLGDKARITLKAFNNAFLQGEIKAEFSLPLDLPVTPKNTRALQYINYNHQRIPVKSFPAKFYVGEILYGNCTLTVRTITENRYSTSLLFGLATLSCLTKRLPEIDYEGNRQIGISQEECFVHADTVASGNYPDEDYTFFPVKNEKFYTDKNPDWEKIINNYRPGIEFKRNPVGQHLNALIPFPFVAYIIRRALLEDGYSPAGSFFAMTEDEQLTLWNNREFECLDNNNLHATRTTNQNSVTIGLVKMIMPVFDDETTPPDNADPGDSYDNVTTGYITMKSRGAKKLKIGIHFGFVSTVTGTNSFTIEAFKSTTGSIAAPGFIIDTTIDGLGPHYREVEIDFNVEDTDIGGFIWIELRAVSGGNYVDCVMLPDSFIDVEDIYFNTILPNGNIINIQNHVPDITFGDFINELCAAFNAFFVQNPNTLTTTFTFVDDLFSQVPKNYNRKQINKQETDLTLEPIAEFDFVFPSSDDNTDNNALPVDPAKVIGSFSSMYGGIPAATNYEQYIFIENENRYYKSEFNGSTFDWIPYSWNYTRQVIAPSGIKVEPKLSPLFMTIADNDNSNQFLIPCIEQEGHSLQFELTNELTGIWLTFFKGMLPDSNTDEFPSGQSHVKDINGNPHGNISLQWDGDTGLINTCWAKTIAAREKGMQHLKDLKMNVADFFNHSPADKIRVDDDNYLIIETDFLIDNKNFISAKHKLLKTI